MTWPKYDGCEPIAGLVCCPLISLLLCTNMLRSCGLGRVKRILELRPSHTFILNRPSPVPFPAGLPCSFALIACLLPLAVWAVDHTVLLGFPRVNNEGALLEVSRHVPWMPGRTASAIPILPFCHTHICSSLFKGGGGNWAAFPNGVSDTGREGAHRSIAGSPCQVLDAAEGLEHLPGVQLEAVDGASLSEGVIAGDARGWGVGEGWGSGGGGVGVGGGGGLEGGAPSPCLQRLV